MVNNKIFLFLIATILTIVLAVQVNADCQQFPNWTVTSTTTAMNDSSRTITLCANTSDQIGVSITLAIAGNSSHPYTLDCNGTTLNGNGNTSSAINRGGSYNYWIIKNCNFVNYLTGVYSSGTQKNVKWDIIDNRFTGMNSSAIEFWGGDNVTILRNNITLPAGTAGTANLYGIFITNAGNNFTISGNKITGQNTATRDEYLLRFGNGATTTVNNSLISDNIFINSGYNGIMIRDGGVNNIIRNNTGQVYFGHNFITCSQSNCLIENNTLTGTSNHHCLDANAYETGLNLRASNQLWQYNNCSGNSVHGFFTGNTTNVTVRYNWFRSDSGYDILLGAYNNTNFSQYNNTPSDGLLDIGNGAMDTTTHIEENYPIKLQGYLTNVTYNYTGMKYINITTTSIVTYALTSPYNNYFDITNPTLPQLLQSGLTTKTTTMGDSKAYKIASLLTDCTVPYEDMLINQSTTLCEGIHYVNDNGGSSGVLYGNANNIIIDLNGAILIGNTSGNGIYIGAKNNITIKNGLVQNYNQNRIRTANNTVRNITFHNMTTYGINLEGYNQTIDNCTFTSVDTLTAVAVQFDGSSLNKYSTIKDSTINGWYRGIYNYEANNTNITRNTIINTADNCIRTRNNAGLAGDITYITNNYFNNCGHNGVDINNNYTLVDSNTFIDIVHHSVDLYDQFAEVSGYNIISNNNITTDINVANHISAIYMRGTSNNNITNNNIIKERNSDTSYTSMGLKLDGNSTDINYNNILFNNNINNVNHYGIWMGGNNTYVYNNTISNTNMSMKILNFGTSITKVILENHQSINISNDGLVNLSVINMINPFNDVENITSGLMLNNTPTLTTYNLTLVSEGIIKIGTPYPKISSITATYNSQLYNTTQNSYTTNVTVATGGGTKSVTITNLDYLDGGNYYALYYNDTFVTYGTDNDLTLSSAETGIYTILKTEYTPRTNSPLLTSSKCQALLTNSQLNAILLILGALIMIGVTYLLILKTDTTILEKAGLLFAILIIMYIIMQIIQAWVNTC